MAEKEQKFKKDGIITESLPNGFFRVQLNEGEEEVLGHLAGKLRVNRIRILPGDRVVIEMTPYDNKRGRIIFRKKWESNLPLKKFVITVRLSIEKDTFMWFVQQIQNINKDKDKIKIKLYLCLDF